MLKQFSSALETKKLCGGANIGRDYPGLLFWRATPIKFDMNHSQAKNGGQDEGRARLILETVFANARVHIRCRTPSLVFARVRTNLR